MGVFVLTLNNGRAFSRPALKPYGMCFGGGGQESIVTVAASRGIPPPSTARTVTPPHATLGVGRAADRKPNEDDQAAKSTHHSRLTRHRRNLAIVAWISCRSVGSSASRR